MIDLSKRVGHGWRPNRTLERLHIAKEHRRYRGDTHRPVHPSANTGKR